MAEKELRTWYFGVVFLTNGEASVSAPFDSEQKCIEAMKEGIRKHPTLVKSTTYITRKGEGMVTLADVFGHPKSRDLMQDKKFIKELEA